MKTLKLLCILCLSLIVSTTFAQEFYVYVSDAANFTSGDYKIVQFDQNGENPIDYITTELGWPQDIVFLEDENRVLVSNLTTGRITKYNSRTGAYVEDFAKVAGGPTRMKIGEDNLLYVLQWSNSINKVLRFQLDGTLVDEYTDVGVVQSIGVDWDDAGNLYVSSFSGATIRKFDSNGMDMGLFIDTNLSGPTNLEIKDGIMYVLDWNAGKCVRFNAGDGSFIDDFITGLTNPEGLAFLPNGDILIGDNGTNSVRHFDSSGNDLGDYTNGGSLMTPNAVVLRDEIFLSTNDTELETAFIVPTVGTTFTINPTMAADFTTMEIFNSSGALIDTIDLTDVTSWNAGHLSEGLYFVLVTTNSGKKVTQKIIVKN